MYRIPVEDFASDQVLIRKFCAATNLSVPGRVFAVPASRQTLAHTLEQLGARIVTAPTERSRASVTVSDLPMPGQISLTPDAVYAPDGTVLAPPTGNDAPDRIAWAASQMPVTSTDLTDLAGLRIGIALVLEPKTAVLALRLAAGGAQVSVYGHPDETRPDVAAYLQEHGVQVYTDPNGDASRPSSPPAVAQAFLSQQFHLLIDDGAHLIRWAHQVPGALDHLRGTSEETTSGLRSLENWGLDKLRVPVIAANNARSKTLFDNAYGTGQSCLMTILDVLDPEHCGVTLPEQKLAVYGYGDVGSGLAKLARALGATVAIIELDPVRQLQARMDGFVCAQPEEILPTIDLAISATGVPHTITLSHLQLLKDGAAVAVAGGVEQEISLQEAERAGATWQSRTPNLELLELPGGSTLKVLDRGGCINCTVGEGNPIEIMDLSFGVQLAALRHLQATQLSPGMHKLPAEADDAVAATALQAGSFGNANTSAATGASTTSSETPQQPEPVAVYSAGLVIPITAPSILNGAVAVCGQRILHVGERDWVLQALENAHTPYTEVNWPGVLLPGLVNAHTHLQYTNMAQLGRGQYTGFEDWASAFNDIYDTSDLDWAAAAANGAVQSIRYGTTTAADVVTDAVAASALHDAGLHGIAYWEVMDWSNQDWENGGLEAVRAGLETVPATPGVGLSPHAPYSLDAAPLLDVPDMARQAGHRLHIHLGESQLEAAWAENNSGPLADLWRSEVASSFTAARANGMGYSATQFVDQLGVLGPDCHVAHGVYMTADDRRRLRSRGTAVALCPRSNRVIGLNAPPVADYLREGNQLAVGTDSLSSSPSLDVLGELPELFALARAQGYHEQDLGRRLLHVATLGGAHALGLAVGKQRVGQLQAGALADMVFLDLPVGDIVSTIDDVVLHGSGQQVATIIAGKLRWAAPNFPLEVDAPALPETQ